MKIRVLLTGGTIGSAVKNGAISPFGSPAEKLEADYRRRGGRAELDFVSPFTILSEDLCADDLNTLTESVRRACESGFEKLIICHGTDTLQYSAAAVLYALAGKRCTAVFVSAAKPLESSETNGFENFCAAAAFLENTDMPGVFAAYQNAGQPARILPAARLALHPEGGDALHCLNGACAAVYQSGKIYSDPSYLPAQSRSLDFPVRFETFSGIEVVTAVPGSAYAPCGKKIRAVLFKPYHSGTLHTAGAAFRAFCQNAKSRGIPLFAADILPGAQYATVERCVDLGIIPLEGAAFAATYIKIWLAAGKSGAELETFVKTSYAGEI